LLVVLLVAVVSAPARAGIGESDLPGNADWYFHADLEAMRTAASGSPLYKWLDGEIFVEIDDEVGIDLNEEIDAVTAFADAALGTVVVVEGPISQATRDKILAMAAADAKLDTRTYDGTTYYHIERGSEARHGSRSLEDLEDAAYFTFGVENKLIVASEQKQLEALLDSGGRIAGGGRHEGSLFVLTADKEFVQAGARTAELADDEADWDSNILRNTEKVSLLVSDRNGMIAVEAQLVSKDPSIAQSLGGIINGLIGLQAFNSDLDPEILRMIQSTKIDIAGNVLSINTVLDPELLVSTLDEEQ
jgi:hypothetical protein